MLKNRYAAFGLFVVVFVLFFNLLDFMYTAWIAGGTYRFSAGLDLGVPLLPGLILGYVLFLHKKES
ncbi:MAG: hypothetical protein IKI50_07015 [Clostridia bacterium]|nr:hypothetical protein [Clostridia bacterium]